MTGIFRKWWLWGLAVVLIAAAAYAPLAAAPQAQPATRPASRPEKVKITISRETTYLLGPLDPDGTVNYLAAVNARLSKGVTRENNAAVLLIQVAGPRHLSPDFVRLGLKILQLPPPPETGHYFVGLEAFEKSQAEKSGREPVAREALRKRLAQAMEAPWSATGHPFIDKWLKANERPLSLVAEATRRPRYYLPIVPRQRPPHLLAARAPTLASGEISRALAARAMLKAGAGDTTSAREDLMALHRWARLVAQLPSTGDRIRACWLETHACRAAIALARGRRLTGVQAKRHLADLQGLPPLPRYVKPVDEFERLRELEIAALLIRKGPRAFMGIKDPGAQGDDRTLVDGDLLLRTINVWYDRYVEALRKPTFPERKAALVALRLDLKKLEQRLRTTYVPTDPKADSGDLYLTGMKALGRAKGRSPREISRGFAEFLVILWLGGDLLSRMPAFVDRHAMESRLAQVCLALAVHRAEKGGYPAELSALKPRYLKTIPKDLFTEKRLKYGCVGKGYLLYSVGENMKDDGGRNNEREKDRKEKFDDIAARAK